MINALAELFAAFIIINMIIGCGVFWFWVMTKIG